MNDITSTITTTNNTNTSRRRRGRIAGATLIATAAVAALGATAHADGGGTGVGRVGGKMHLEDISLGIIADQPSTDGTELPVACYDPDFNGGVFVAVGDVDGDGKVDDLDLSIWQAQYGSTDSFSFAVEREMKESGEKGGTTDTDVVVGELPGCAGSRYGDAGEQTYLAVELENAQITSYQLGVLDNDASEYDTGNHYYNSWNDLVFLGATAHADYNRDGVVDAADFLVWQQGASADKDHKGWVIIQSMSSPIYR